MVPVGVWLQWVSMVTAAGQCNADPLVPVPAWLRVALGTCTIHFTSGFKAPFVVRGEEKEFVSVIDPESAGLNESLPSAAATEVPGCSFVYKAF